MPALLGARCESKIQLETVHIKERLMKLNNAGFLTINSQPRVNGADSTDPAVGWGRPGGYVYQKVCVVLFDFLSCFVLRVHFKVFARKVNS